MATTVIRKTDVTKYFAPTKGALNKLLTRGGRIPPVSIIITPIDGGRKRVSIDRFVNYSFNSSMLIPVDTFSFGFAAPDDKKSAYDQIKEGDIVTVYANNIPLSTGVIDSVEIETDADFGEKVNINGRDLMAQLEDQSAVSADALPIYGNSMTVAQVISKVTENTRIRADFIDQDAPKKPFLFATEPGESKLASLQRFLEPLNVLMWMSPTGRIKIGRPNMAQQRKGVILCSKTKRQSNVLSIKAIHSSATIPNIIVPIWSAQEGVQERVAPSQGYPNAAKGPNRLLKAGHRLPRAVVVSTPQGASAQDLSTTNAIKTAGGSILESHAKRELARLNHQELIVQAVVNSHYNENGEPWQVDQVYYVEYDRANINKEMYLFQVDYSCSDERGQITSLYFCNKGTIVSDIKVK